MIENWEIRENTVSKNSVYMLVLKGTDEEAALLERSLAGFATLVPAKVNPFTHVMELNITDDDMLEKVRIKIEKTINESSEEAEHFVTDAGKEAVIDAEAYPANPETTMAKMADPYAFGSNLQDEIEKKEQAEKEDILRIMSQPQAPKPGSKGTGVSASLQLADSGLSLKRENPDLDVAIEIENQDLDVGDGTMINLGSVSTKLVKDMSGYNGKAFEDMQASAAAKEEKKESLRPMGGGIARLGTNPSSEAVAKLEDAPGATFLRAHQSGKAEVKNFNTEPQPGKEEKKGGLFGKFMNKISSVKDDLATAKNNVAANIVAAKSNIAAKKAAQKDAAPRQISEQQAEVQAPQQNAPLPASAPARPAPEQQPAAGVNPTAEFNHAAPKMPAVKEAQTPLKKNTIFGKKDNAAKPVVPAAQQQTRHSTIVGSGDTAFKTAAKKTAPGKEAQKPAGNVFNPETLAAEIFKPGSSDSLTSQMPVDDIFAAETILQFYDDTPPQAAQKTEETVADMLSSMPPPSSAPALGDDLLDVPANLLGSAPAERATANSAVRISQRITAPKDAVVAPPAQQEEAQGAAAPAPLQMQEEPAQEAAPAVTAAQEEVIDPAYQAAQEVFAPKEETKQDDNWMEEAVSHANSAPEEVSPSAELSTLNIDLPPAGQNPHTENADVFAPLPSGSAGHAGPAAITEPSNEIFTKHSAAGEASAAPAAKIDPPKKPAFGKPLNQAIKAKEEAPAPIVAAPKPAETHPNPAPEESAQAEVTPVVEFVQPAVEEPAAFAAPLIDEQEEVFETLPPQAPVTQPQEVQQAQEEQQPDIAQSAPAAQQEDKEQDSFGPGVVDLKNQTASSKQQEVVNNASPQIFNLGDFSEEEDLPTQELEALDTTPAAPVQTPPVKKALVPPPPPKRSAPPAKEEKDKMLRGSNISGETNMTQDDALKDAQILNKPKQAEPAPRPAVPQSPVAPAAPQRPAQPAPRPVPPPVAPKAPAAPAAPRPVAPQSPAAPQQPAAPRPAPAQPAQHFIPAVAPAKPKSPPPAQAAAARAPQPAAAPKPQDAGDKTTTIDHTIQVSAGQVYKRSNWPLEIPLIPTFTFDTMDMASNRFSHANAMSVVDNVGTVYNPFFIYGESGSGKTHFLHAMGYELSKKVPQEKIFVTNGVRFARGIQRYVEEGKTEHLEGLFLAAEVLIIDDIHLTAVNEHNREIISKILNRFLKERKQIIISSKYPPESLARFEELVNFKLDQGWVSELKPPRPQHFTRIYNKMAEQADLGLSEVQTHSFFGADNLTLGKISRDIRRVKVLHRRIFDSGSPEKTYEDLLSEMLASNGENEHSEIIKKDFADITALTKSDSKEWGNFGFFFPQDQADKFKWVSFAIMQKAKELGIKGGFTFALKSAYSTENIISSAFKIANICDNKNLKGAIILGPSLTVCPPPIRDNFYDIVSHMLEVMMIRCGIIDAEMIKHPSTYIKVLGDIIK